MTFESELSLGKFYLPICVDCKKVCWPPTDFCNNCFGLITLDRMINEGKIIEFSGKDEAYFCLVEFKKEIRLMAKIKNQPQIGQIVKIDSCGISDGNYFFNVI